RLVYGRDVLAAGPTLLAAVRAETAIRIRFAGATRGLETSDGAPPRGFLIAGADRVWHRASARIDRDGVVVSSPDVPAPIAVRYGWGNDPPNTLKNGADLPAAPFRTDGREVGALRRARFRRVARRSAASSPTPANWLGRAPPPVSQLHPPDAPLVVVPPVPVLAWPPVPLPPVPLPPLPAVAPAPPAPEPPEPDVPPVPLAPP